MSTQYTTEPPPTATVLLHTTAGPLTLSLFAQQTVLTCRNFLQLVIDGYYDNHIFHRVSSGFVIQTGDPTGTGEGGENIYEDRDFERYDEKWGRLMKLPEERKGEKIVFGDEIHSRLKFNRRGLVGMAKMQSIGGGQYGSQFFITLGDCRAELDGKCTMFGRVEGDGIYNVVKIAEGELIEGTERPLYPEKILRAEILEMPSGEAWNAMKPRSRIATRTVDERTKGDKKKQKKKSGKALLSFGADEGEGDAADIPVKPKKAKFNTALIDGGKAESEKQKSNSESKTSKSPLTKSISNDSPTIASSSKRKADSVSQNYIDLSPEPKRRKPSFHESTTQLPIRNPESPLRSPTPSPPPSHRVSTSQPKTAAEIQTEIAALKASMRREVAPAAQTKSRRSALESMIPSTSTRGRRRPKPGDTNAQEDDKALKMLSAFRARLEGASTENGKSTMSTIKSKTSDGPLRPQTHSIIHTSKTTDATPDEPPENDEEEEQLCDLHFIINCQSCTRADDMSPSNPDNDDDDDDRAFLTHSLSFAKDRLGKDLNWKRKNEEELVVIDPRERERELGIKSGGKGKGKARERDGGGGGGGREWDRAGRR